MTKIPYQNFAMACVLILIMNKANLANIQDQSGDVYQSISSNQNEKLQLPAHLQVNKSNQYASHTITFPNKPPEFDRLMQIYKENQNKLKKLSHEVHQLEVQKLKKLRLSRNDKTQQDFDFQEIVSNSDISKIEYYKERRAEREKELRELKQLYTRLNQINQKEAYLLNENHFNKALAIINKHKQVQSYKIANDNLIVLTQQLQNCIEEDSVQSETRLNQSSILIQNHDREFYTVAIFKLKNLLQWMKGKDVDLWLQQKKNIQELVKCKVQAENQVIVVKSTNIYSSQRLQSATFSEDFQLIFVQNEANIIAYNLNGEIKQTLNFDKIDQILSFQVIKTSFLVVTTEGVIRHYHISSDNQFKLAQIARCCSVKSGKLNRASFQQQKGEIKLLYSINDGLFSFDLKSYEIKQRGSLLKAKHNLNSLLKSYFQTSFSSLTQIEIQLVNRVLTQKIGPNKMILVDIYKQKPAQTHSALRIILGDQKGKITIHNV